MKILAIETSCDETALAILDADIDKGNKTAKEFTPDFKVLGTALYSQIETHKPYGGVFPAIAKREHSTNLVPLLNSLLQNDKINFEDTELGEKILSDKKEIIKEILSHEPELYDAFIDFIPKTKKPDFDMIAVTVGPGLEPALWVGINFARALSLIWNIPVMPTNHMEGHIASVLKQAEDLDTTKIDVEFPAIALLISGGHTEIVLVKNWGHYQILGATLDDAVGEAFDKTARLLGLPYPGGPQISKLAAEARAEKNNIKSPKEETVEQIDHQIKLPRPMIKTDDFNFSFSGLKTAVLYLIQKLEKENKLDDEMKKKIALEFESAATEVLLHKTKKAIKKTSSKSLIIGGGVIANQYIREIFTQLEQENIKIFIPEKSLATDNAVMIGIAGAIKSLKEEPQINPEMRADGNLRLS